jgi:subtilisin-like proprotein convertase family protein
MKKTVLLVIFLIVSRGYSQSVIWTPLENNYSGAISKNTKRNNFPQDFKLFELNLVSFRQVLQSASDRLATNAKGLVIAIPNIEGQLERFEIYEASNFTPELQSQFPEIRAYVGIGIDDKTSQIRLSVSPKGIQTMVFRNDKSNEFIENYSEDGKIYAVFNSSRVKGSMPFTCSTDDVAFFNSNKNKITLATLSSNGSYKTMRLALSCTAEYSNYFGANSSANLSLVIAAFNNTMTRVNGVFEKDLAVHLNIISANNIIYYDPSTDPYSEATIGTDTANSTSADGWNIQLQNTLTDNIGNSVYDIGHLFGASGGGGNAGCIGCVCVDDTNDTMDKNKGSGFTSPSDGNPMGDNFDIDFVAHEMGHQLGGNHTFSFSTENNAVNVEPGSGSTIMAYAGVTYNPTSATSTCDIQMHSDAYFAYRSILQIQTNLASKLCPVSVVIPNNLSVNVIGSSYTIPKGTPFVLTGNGNANSYCWEENDDATFTTSNPPTQAQIDAIRAASYPSTTKTNGPNFRSLTPITTPVRYMPALATVLGGSLTTTWETVSTVARTLNFTLTGRDNAAAGSAQTKTATMAVSVSGTVGPFAVTSQSAVEAWNTGETKVITWNRNSAETLVGSTNVDILLSTDGGLTFPITLASGVTNSGTANITVPSIAPSQTCRLMIKPTGNIYYAVNSSPFYIGYVINKTCATYNYTTAFALPDAGTNYTIKSITVPTTAGTIYDVNVTVNLTHPNLQNLVVAIVRPGVSTPSPLVNLFNQNCSGNANMNVTFDSQATALVCASPTSGTYQPTATLNAYNGFPATGNWQVGFWDKVAGNSGTVNSFSIQICTQEVSLASDDFAFDSFSLYPNPNNGSFNVKFNSNSSNDIKVAVYDMRGREILNKSYQNTGTFDQNVQLENVQSGIYLVNVQDGDKKVVKKIVVE